MPSPRAWSAIHLAIVGVVAAVYVLTMRDGHNWGGDFAQYLHHAQNIAEGRPYAETGYIYNPHNTIVGPRAYPPIFPVVLAPAYRAFGLNLTAFKIQLVVVFAVALLVTRRLFADTLGPSRAALYLALLGFTPVFWQFKDEILSEHVFMVFWYLAILVGDRWYRGETPSRSVTTHAVLLGATMYLAYATRSVGIVLLPAVLLCELATARRLTRFGTIALATAAGLILLQRVILPASGQGYLDQLRLITVRGIATHLYEDTVALSYLWVNGVWQRPREAAGVLLSLAGLAGFIRVNVPKPTFLGVAMILYFILVVVWPSASWVRIILPLLPGYLYYVLCGLDHPRLPSRARTLAVACIGVFAAGSWVSWYSRADYGPIDGVGNPTAGGLFTYVERETTETDVVMFFKPRVLSLYTGRRATPYPQGEDAALLRESADAAGVTLFIARVEADMPLERALDDGADSVEEVWRNDAFRIYRPAVAGGFSSSAAVAGSSTSPSKIASATTP